jgi:hypothetical protein
LRKHYSKTEKQKKKMLEGITKYRFNVSFNSPAFHMREKITLNGKIGKPLSGNI